MRIFNPRVVASAAIVAGVLGLTSGRPQAAIALTERPVISTFSEESWAAFRKHAVELLLASNYGALDAAYDDLRDGNDFFSDGYAKLAVFYDALLSRTADGSQVPHDKKAEHRRERAAAFESWLASNPRSTVARVLLAKTQSEYAWELRGHGYASEVTPEQWQGFARAMGDAIETLNGIAHLDPEAYGLAISIASETGQPRDEQDGLFDQAASAFPSYPAIYWARTTSLMPKWGGSPTDICDLAKSLAASSDGIKILAYSTVAEAAEDDPAKRGHSFASGCLDWTVTKQSFERRAAARGLSNYDGNAYLAMAAAMHDVDAARRATSYVTAYEPECWPSVQAFNFFLNWPTNIRGPDDPPTRPPDRPMHPATVPTK